MQKTGDAVFFAERRSPMNVEGQCPALRDLFLTIDVMVSCRNDLVPELLISLSSPVISRSHPIDYYFQSQ